MRLRYAVFIAVLNVLVLIIGLFVPGFAFQENPFTFVSILLLVLLLTLELCLVYWKRSMYGVIGKPSEAEELLESVRDQFVYSMTDFRAQGLIDPAVQKLTLYVDGVESFGETFTIYAEDGEFSGTCGITLESSVGRASKLSVDTVQVWLAGDDHIRSTIGRFITPTVNRYGRGENSDRVQLIRKGATLSREMDIFHVKARVIDELQQNNGTQRIIDRIVIELAVWLAAEMPTKLEMERV